MKLSELPRRLLVPLVLLSVVFTGWTLASPYVEAGSGLAGWIHRNLDLRHEVTLAVCFEGFLILVCGMSFVPLSSLGRLRKGFPRYFRVLFILCAAGCVFLAADEGLMIHERLGARLEASTGLTAGSRIEGWGFSWVLVYGPAALTALVIISCALGRMIAAMPAASRLRRRAWVFLGLVVLAVPAVLTCEIVEAAAMSGGAPGAPVVDGIEETLEIIGALGLLACNVTIAREYRL